MFKSAFLILSGNAATSIILFARNLLVARLISVEDYGIAATFAISMAMVEMMSTIGLQQLIVQDKEGNNPKLQASLHGFNLLRGLFSGVVLFFLAHPIARFLGVEEIAWAYQLLALVPVIRGFFHFDMDRLHRQLKFLPSILNRTIPAFLSLLLIWPFYLMFNDYRVMLYVIVVQALMITVSSHLLAERKFHLSFDREIIAQALRFGWPLLINNVLLFFVFQGEKLIVGREMGMATLAILAMGITLTLTPSLLLAKSTQSFFLPQLSAQKDSPEHFQKLACATLQFSLISGLFLVATLSVIGEPAIKFLLGDEYLILTSYLIWLGILQAARLFKAGCSVVALSQAHTENAMIANMFRVLSLPIAWYFAATGGSLLSIIWIAAAGELCGSAAALSLVQYRLRLPIKRIALPLLGAAAILATFGYSAWINHNISTWSDLWSWGLVALLGLLTLIAMKDLRRYIANRTLSKHID